MAGTPLPPNYSETKSFSSEDHGLELSISLFNQSTQQHLCTKALKNYSAFMAGTNGRLRPTF